MLMAKLLHPSLFSVLNGFLIIVFLSNLIYFMPVFLQFCLQVLIFLVADQVAQFVVQAQAIIANCQTFTVVVKVKVWSRKV